MPIGLTPFSRRSLFGATLFCSLIFLPRSFASFGIPVPNGANLAPNGRVARNPTRQLCLICLCQSLGQAEATGREGLTVGWNRFPFPARLKPV